MNDTLMCSYNDCTDDPVTTLEINGEEKPVCSDHIQDMVDQHQSSEPDKQPGDYPVFTEYGDHDEETAAAWINTDKNGDVYLSVKKKDGDYLNLYPDNSDAIEIVMHQVHEVQKQQ